MIILRVKYLVFGTLRAMSYSLMETWRDIGALFELHENLTKRRINIRSWSKRFIQE